MHNGDMYRVYTAFSVGLQNDSLLKIDKSIFSQDEGTFV